MAALSVHADPGEVITDRASALASAVEQPSSVPWRRVAERSPTASARIAPASLDISVPCGEPRTVRTETPGIGLRDEKVRTLGIRDLRLSVADPAGGWFGNRVNRGKTPASFSDDAVVLHSHCQCCVGASSGLIHGHGHVPAARSWFALVAN